MFNTEPLIIFPINRISLNTGISLLNFELFFPKHNNNNKNLTEIHFVFTNFDFPNIL